MDRRFSPLGDCGVRISFGHNISPSIGQKMMNVKRKIEEKWMERDYRYRPELYDTFSFLRPV